MTTWHNAVEFLPKMYNLNLAVGKPQTNPNWGKLCKVSGQYASKLSRLWTCLVVQWFFKTLYFCCWGCSFDPWCGKIPRAIWHSQRKNSRLWKIRNKDWRRQKKKRLEDTNMATRCNVGCWMGPRNSVVSWPEGGLQGYLLYNSLCLCAVWANLVTQW